MSFLLDKKQKISQEHTSPNILQINSESRLIKQMYITQAISCGFML